MSKDDRFKSDIKRNRGLFKLTPLIGGTFIISTELCIRGKQKSWSFMNSGWVYHKKVKLKIKLDRLSWIDIHKNCKTFYFLLSDLWAYKLFYAEKPTTALTNEPK